MGVKLIYFMYVSFEIIFENLKFLFFFVLNIMFEIELLSENFCLFKYMFY